MTEEMLRFLSVVKTAHRAVFSVPKEFGLNKKFLPHMRTFGAASDYQAFLSALWPRVTVDLIGLHWLLGVCEGKDE